jgi:hypothetical protein
VNGLYGDYHTKIRQQSKYNQVFAVYEQKPMAGQAIAGHLQFFGLTDGAPNYQ